VYRVALKGTNQVIISRDNYFYKDTNRSTYTAEDIPDDPDTEEPTIAETNHHETPQKTNKTKPKIPEKAPKGQSKPMEPTIKQNPYCTQPPAQIKESEDTNQENRSNQRSSAEKWAHLPK